MSDPAFVNRVNREYFDGGLPPRFVERLADLPTERDDVRAFVERTFRFMEQAGLGAADLSELQGEVFGSLLARILPGAWSGRVPPITVKGRHEKIDQYVQDNRYIGRHESARMLDLGCGFPPETTLDTADMLPGWTIHGSDPSMPRAMVYDAEGAYATFADDGHMIYCQPSAPTVENWNALLADLDATAARFAAIRSAFGDVPPGHHEAADGSRLLVEPLRSFERPGLSFGVGGIFEVDASDFDVVRCFNVLYYFDDDYRDRALDWFAGILAEGGILMVGGDWAFTTECRYFLYQKAEDDHMHAREFTFSVDNVLPVGVLPFFALHDKDRGMTKLAELVRVLRDDEGFVTRYTAAADALRRKHDICPRGDDGFYGTVDPDRDPEDLWRTAQRIADTLAAEFAEEAAGLLRDSGRDAWVNEIGMVSVRLT